MMLRRCARAIGAASLIFALATPSAAQDLCRQALALGLDVSGSVDAREYRLQLDGLAAALGDTDVRAALLSTPDIPVRLAVYEWAEPREERLILGWTAIKSEADLARVQTTLRATLRSDMGASTGIGSALRTGFNLLAQQDRCFTRTLDISGDGKGNTGQRPQDVANMPPDVTVNGLVIGVDESVSADNRNLQIGELTAYYAAFVIRGPDAFVETALGFDDFEDAMRRKLLRELRVMVIGRVLDPQTDQ
ncbi:DUF1194 domain-containing protein [Pseudooctadecabacter jejudonensis]|uniref:VWFA domain-containing protein n=1 Tax=Pseudooctadecabacter jejudonensis TaxID=1391910 RepID=A0A1Y5RNI5_9RHOB|nr:DUF1194 domain-containing protein [Pseudooctadecabacter jejudonensis]SLN21755.1 hypothetical protein PSJ8397_00847 [Pseudooctadecabacter jejudonensis]